MSMIPGVVHKDKNGNERLIDLGTRLLADRIIMVTGEITDELAESVVAQLLYLESESKEKLIKMFINSPGGSVLAGLSIISCMLSLKCEISTYVSGLAASMGIVIAASGTKGKRYVYPMSRILVHQCSGGAQGNVQDVAINYKEMEKLNDILMEHLGKCCGKKVEQLKKDCERDAWFSAEEAIEYGLLDKLVEKHK